MQLELLDLAARQRASARRFQKTPKAGTKFVHAWLQFRANYKSGEVVNTTCFLGLRVAEHNRFAIAVCIYDTASQSKASPYGEGEDGK